MTYDLVSEGRPMNILPIMDELKLDRPYGPDHNTWLFGLVNLLLTSWFINSLVSLGHVFLMDDFVTSTNSFDSAFAAQMALSVGVAPAVEALLGGTVLKQDRFNNKREKRLFLEEDEETGGLRVSPWLEALQLSLSHPGPVFLTVAVAFLQGHGDVVQEYFFLNHLPLYNGVYC